jgi:pimeloyl-ACP methyl ester carboxylesterase
MPLAYTRELAEYWRDHYDWRSRESNLNRFAQFTTLIDGLDIHFIHQRSPHADAFPLLITHGWPGSVAEFAYLIGPLTDPTAHGGRAEDAFHVVCPSLPGFGFSGKPVNTGWGVEAIARAWATLMGRLGYRRYGAHGGDWGSVITTALGRNPGGCAAIHLTMPVAAAPDQDGDETDAGREAEALNHYQQWESGYQKLQATRPQTIGYGLVDSPVAQLAWIVEKFRSWTDCDGHPENAVSRDALLDNVMLYWVTGTGASAARLYWESSGAAFASDAFVSLPTGVAAFPKEIIRCPRRWCERVYHITHWTDMSRGGHFAALEQPDLLAADVRDFFSAVR